MDKWALFCLKWCYETFRDIYIYIFGERGIDV